MSLTSFRSLALPALLAALALGSARAEADDRIWTGIVLASQSPKPKAPPTELTKVAEKVEHFFGYNQLELIGSASKNLEEQGEHWLVPTQHFWVSVKSKRLGESEYLLQIGLFHDRHTLVETEARLGPNSPLLIRGPMHARGQLLVVLQVVH